MSKIITDYILQDGVNFLRAKDPVIDRICELLPPLDREFREPNFEGMARIIINQQLSGAAARTIFGRLVGLNEQSSLTPEFVMNLADADIQGCGVSKAKTHHIKALAAHFLANPFYIESISNLNSEDLQSEVQKIKGFGPWSAAVFALFYMRHQNIFVQGDVSILRAISDLYGERTASDKGRLEALISTWDPYNSVACMLMWDWIDTRPIGKNI